MSEDSPHSSNGSANKSLIDKFVQLFTGEPQNKEELVEVLNDAEDRELIKPETKLMIEGVLEVSDMRVRDIMIPRSQMITLDINTPLNELLPVIIDSGHSRFPVINEDIDHIEGILLAKDLLAYGFEQQAPLTSLQEVIRQAIIVPESKRVEPLLKEFRSQRYHMAIVVDEYGGVSGVVTIEDILELIVGEIEDETDDEIEEDIKYLAGNVYQVKALTELDDFMEYFNCQLDEGDSDTIGGVVLHTFGHMPRKGEEVTINKFEYKVTSADSRRLQTLQVTVPKNHKVNGKPTE
ncbi:transporter associated domain-containing protein [Thalassotalea sp. 1_MG-2023]|uniref:HlyC/CorC family transporter n=1 Tax=Thalassotalea sp. 1_MG-2023 TaxID=3062680 RepID=UPI0026E153CA|nr:transporter associated domain-containing protein [Thalassotalea sp. 1_MG-2023]MDO6428247.1 transporter associated domain-containing protein [Thalassotalea sp. 1_MG-2023]